MRKIPLLWALIGLLIVVVCVWDDEGSEVVGVKTAVFTPPPTQTSIPPASTSTLTNTPTQMPIEILTPTETIVPSTTPFPTPTPLPSVPFTDESYKLVEYDLGKLIHLIEQCNNIEHSHEDCNEGTSSLNYGRILNNDFKRFFPDGFPEVITFVETYPFQSNEYFFTCRKFCKQYYFKA